MSDPNMDTLASNVQCYHNFDLNTKYLPAMVAAVLYVIVTYGLFAYAQAQFLTKQKYATDNSVQNFNTKLTKLAFQLTKVNFVYASEEELTKIQHMIGDLYYIQSDVYKSIAEASYKFS